MLSEKRLRELAVKTQTTFINVVREYMQNLFLNYFYSLEKSENIYFKGGTALRILYRSPRFSEDLDFSAPSINRKLIEDLIEEVSLRIDKEGIAIDINEATITSGGYLSIIDFEIGGEKFGVTLEISARKKKPSGELVLIDNPYIDAYSVMALKREELIAEKIEALLNRKKPRDFYDLYFMLRANLLPEKAVLKMVLPLVEKTQINFKHELGEFLPQGQQRIIKDFKQTLISEIRRFVV
ncbi:MAG: nucleotidyl transferase AbiEii/AbiGii toxin family protein [Candidatus Margulisbacteria bacterium]|nr:nucleotidyl transferase AbiEii/AbiGii toxin family protein [Candidatus Margulisiibacteriota bacterium]MBU1021229.1 nucleotidyl transferase AbiEii/AbiGii toxin family protein [Candidatus Margulisiibacteriota bacterium]MBU1729835.1 nucleotidyl transferase AbiEii/AbiGii toxin family protein [Candidatus Margulisiibacteriota bacterium]MBU1955336.1 nucleotidyl transferase AbiEii/AbiGii toxin family protein [Candidatus Margulisiibacteriota bacterium]